MIENKFVIYKDKVKSYNNYVMGRPSIYISRIDINEILKEENKNGFKAIQLNTYTIPNGTDYGEKLNVYEVLYLKEN